MLTNEKLNLPEGVPPLRTYYLYMSGACNLACRHCWITPTYLAANELDTGEKSLPFDLYELATREGEPLGLTHIKFTGGEPFIHPEAERMLLYAAERKIGVTIETNGTLITNERARFLREKTSVTFLSVSLDGASAGTHDYMRGKPGSFARAQAGIKNLVEYGYYPQVIMSLFEGNVDEIESLAQWAASAGCSSLKLNIIQESGRGSQFDERIQGIEQIIKLGHWVKEDLQKRVGIPVFYSWPPAFRSLQDMTNGEGYASCDIFNIMGILHSGHLAMCGIGMQDKNLVYGLLGKDPVAEVWINNPVLKQIRDAIPGQLKGICGNCMLRDACLGLCAADTYHRTGSIIEPFWFCSQADQAGLFPESRKRKMDHQN